MHAYIYPCIHVSMHTNKHTVHNTRETCSHIGYGTFARFAALQYGHMLLYIIPLLSISWQAWTGPPRHQEIPGGSAAQALNGPKNKKMIKKL